MVGDGHAPPIGMTIALVRAALIVEGKTIARESVDNLARG
jgi:hypothetical protein